MLIIEPSESSRIHHGVRGRPSVDRHVPNETRIYTLQAAEAGIATDYHKMRLNVMRVRAEAEQFLFAASSPAICLEWVDKLNTGAVISLALDDREEPEYRTLPGFGSNGLVRSFVPFVARADDTTPSDDQIFVLLLTSGGQANMLLNEI